MKVRAPMICALMLVLSGTSLSANADMFSGPFDWWDNNDDYNRYNYRDGRGYGGDRWRQYDEWEPNYWRYRFFDNDSNDRFDGDYFGYGRNNSNFDMNMGFGGDSRYDGNYDNDYRFQDDRRGYTDRYSGRSNRDYDRRGYTDRYSGRSNRDYDRRPAPREYGEPRYRNEDQYNDEYWRNYSRRYNGSYNRGESDIRERDPRR